MRRLALAAALTAGIIGVVLFGTVSSGNHASTQKGGLTPSMAAPGADLSGNVAVAAAKSPAQNVGMSRAYRTPPLRTMKSAPYTEGPRQAAENERPSFLRVPLRGLPEGDGALQTKSSGTRTPAPDQNFEGINNMCSCYPPDTNGAAGATQYVQVVNAHFAVLTKTGTQVVPPTTINTLFPGTPHCATLNRGDPAVVYDQFTQRWVITQFAFSGGGNVPPYWECTAVATTSDAAGSWCGYEFQVHAQKFNDYPKIGVWPSQNAYTMTANQFLLGASYAGVGIWAFERDQMLNCQTARFVYQDMEAIDPYLPATLPADADGALAPPAGAPAPFVSINQDGSGLPQDQIQITTATVDWTGTPSMTIAHEADVQAAPYDENLCDYGTCIPH